MAEYIDREKLIKEIDEAMDSDGLGYCVGQTMKRYLQNQPVADVAPVVHGKWLEKEDFKTFYTCSCCNEDFFTLDGTSIEDLWNYCPNCGAKMIGE